MAQDKTKMVPRSKGPSADCPNCGELVKCQQTRRVNEMYRVGTYTCQNPDCLHVFQMSISYLKPLTIPIKINPRITFSFPTFAKQLAALAKA